MGRCPAISLDFGAALNLSGVLEIDTRRNTGLACGAAATDPESKAVDEGSLMSFLFDGLRTAHTEAAPAEAPNTSLVELIS